MSYKVKPEDIPEEMHEICDGMLEPKHIASVINAAIDLELVSPPVYTVRDNQGNLLDDEVYGLWSNPDAAESQHKEDYTAEHWKGQTE